MTDSRLIWVRRFLLINSPYHGLNSKVTTVQYAVNLLKNTTV